MAEIKAAAAAEEAARKQVPRMAILLLNKHVFVPFIISCVGAAGKGSSSGCERGKEKEEEQVKLCKRRASKAVQKKSK